MGVKAWAVAVACGALGVFACQESPTPDVELDPTQQGGPSGPATVTPSGGNGTGPDGGSEGGTADAGTRRAALPFGTPGPWPEGNVQYGRAQGILENPVVGMSTDETQNLWVATGKALYLLQPGQTQFKRYDAADGLHLMGNPVAYCDNNFGTPDAGPRCPIYGEAAPAGITEIVGGGPDEVFVGYAGIDEGSGDWDDPNRHSGKLDRVRLNADGTLQVDRIDLVANNHGAHYWHNRTVQRMVFDHFHHPHDLYLGMNHGVTLLRPDKFRVPKKGEWFDTVYMEYMADHLHARVCAGAPCAPNAGASERGQRMGDWRGLAIGPDGHLWTAGRWTAGKIKWDPDLKNWFSRPGSQAFLAAFGDPYPLPPNANGFVNEPVFRPMVNGVMTEGEVVDLTAVSVAPDGRVWFSSGPTKPEAIAYGVAVWDGLKFTVFDPVTELGMEEKSVRDLLALPDGRILLAGANSGLVLYDPATRTSTPLKAPQWIPDNHVRRLALDTMVSPPVIHVSTYSGATQLRALP